MRSSPPESTLKRRSFIGSASTALAGLVAGLPFLRMKNLPFVGEEGEAKKTTVTPHRHAVPRIQKSENQNG